MRKRKIATLVALAAACSAAAIAGTARAGAENSWSSSNTTAASHPVAIPRFNSVIAPPQAGSDQNLVFNDTFSGDKLNSSVWSTCYPWANPALGCTNYGNDNEQEWYSPSQVTVSGGALHLTATREVTNGFDKNGAPKKYYCRSGMATTFPGFHFKYGYLQVVARIPYGTGLWPALWLTPADQSWPPEIDLMEHWASYYTYHVYFHHKNGTVSSGKRMTPNLSKGWHIFGVYWSKSAVIWYIDGRKMLTVRQGVPQQPMAFVANLADYKPPQKFGGCSGTLLIRSLRLWQQ